MNMKYYTVIFSIALLFTACSGENQEGKALYQKHCANCHGDQGEGLEQLNPPLANSDMLKAAGPGAACWIQNGLHGPIVVNGQNFEHVMPPMPQLSAIEIVNILNYVNNSWGNKRIFITLEEINKVLENCN